jgi:hypothetical protein
LIFENPKLPRLVLNRSTEALAVSMGDSRDVELCIAVVVGVMSGSTITSEEVTIVWSLSETGPLSSPQ